MSAARGALELAKEAVPAGASAGILSIGGALATTPPWLVALGQAVIVVVFTVRAIDKRQSRLHERVNYVQGGVEVLEGKFGRLPCQLGKSCDRCSELAADAGG